MLSFLATIQHGKELPKGFCKREGTVILQIVSNHVLLEFALWSENEDVKGVRISVVVLSIQIQSRAGNYDVPRGGSQIG